MNFNQFSKSCHSTFDIAYQFVLNYTKNYVATLKLKTSKKIYSPTPTVTQFYCENRPQKCQIYGEKSKKK